MKLEKRDTKEGEILLIAGTVVYNLLSIDGVSIFTCEHQEVMYLVDSKDTVLASFVARGDEASISVYEETYHCCNSRHLAPLQPKNVLPWCLSRSIKYEEEFKEDYKNGKID